jgi:uncharacterized protein YbaP (TraB family)
MTLSLPFSAALTLRLRTLSLLALVLTNLLPWHAVQAESAVWVATQGEQKVYLGGTVHLLRPSDYPLPEPFETAYQDSQTLYFETDIAGMSDFSVQARMMQELLYSDGRTLQSVLDAPTYAALAAHVATTGLPMQMMERFKPGMLVSTLQVIEFQKMGFTPQGVDAYFNSRALGDGKQVGELESVDAQIGFISTMGEGVENEFVRSSLEDMEAIDTAMEQMIAAWRSGDNATLEALFVADMKAQYPALYDTLLVRRNTAWVEIIDTMLETPGTEFVLVGAAHLVGEDGLLRLLEGKGYSIAQVP